ncbi:MAG: tetratricopeptide repeat protein [Chloroflexi bacterium]|nr:tetratricopeptide repeat protein [Chloroflexota bacterium]
MAANQRAEFLRLARLPLETTPEAVLEDKLPHAPPTPRPENQEIVRRPPLAQAMNALIGREAERNILLRLLGEDRHRLVTVLGAGGSGKTRLAQQIAFDMQTQFRDGAAFVSLTSVAEGRHLPMSIAEALGLPLPQGINAQDRLLQLLAERQLLLVLDNFEHLLVSATPEDDTLALLQAVLRGAPGLQLLITSRERLRILSERTFELAGLSTPRQAASIEQSDAVMLFIERAQQVTGHFSLTPANREAIARICNLLEGIPLALELAAAWVRVLTCEEIADEIQRNIDFLALADRDTAPRHRSMRAVFDHSWALLDEKERDVLMKLAIFQGGCRRDAAEAVAGATLPVLASLIDKSLLRRTTNGRYDLHELIRQYAQVHLVQTGQLAAVQQRHAQTFLNYAEGVERRFYSAECRRLRDQLEPDIDNFRSAFEWGLSSEGLATMPDLALRLATTLPRFWYVLPNWREGKQWLQRALAHSQNLSPAMQARIQLGFGIFEHAWSHYSVALKHFEAAKPLFEQRTDPRYSAWIYNQTAQCYFAVGRLDEADAATQESLARFRSVGDKWTTGVATWLLGCIAKARQDYAGALTLAQECLNIFRSLDDSDCMVLALNLQGELALLQNDFVQAERHYRASLTLCEKTNNQHGKAWVDFELGETMLGQGQMDQAVVFFCAALAFRLAIGDQETACTAFQGLAVAAAQSGQTKLAARLFSAATRSTRGDGFFLMRTLEPLYQASRTQTQTALNDQTWAAEWTAGQLIPAKELLEAAAAM